MGSRRNMCDYLKSLMLVSYLIFLSTDFGSGQQMTTPVSGVQFTIEDIVKQEVTRQIQAINNEKVKDEVLKEVRQDIDQIKKGKYKIYNNKDIDQIKVNIRYIIIKT